MTLIRSSLPVKRLHRSNSMYLVCFLSVGIIGLEEAPSKAKVDITEADRTDIDE